MSIWDDAGDGRPEIPRLFATTQWSVVLRAKNDSFTALDSLFNQYRKPMLVHVLAKGYAPDQAEDLVQGFCAHLLKPRKQHFLSYVDQKEGKFRSYLRCALDNYMRDEWDRKRAFKRGGGLVPDSLDETDADGQVLRSPQSSTPSADLAYDKAWVEAVLKNSLRAMEESLDGSDKVKLFQALKPTLLSDPSLQSYEAIAEHFNKTKGAIKIEAHRLRKELIKRFRDELMQTVSNEAEFKEELRYLISLFGQQDGVLLCDPLKKSSTAHSNG